jgi:hypothetical protein
MVINNNDALEKIEVKYNRVRWGHLTEHKQYYERMINELQIWDNTMTRKTYRIELKIDFADDTRHELVEQLVRQYGRDLLSSTMLLQDGRKPLVALVVDDSFVGTEEIELLQESDNIHKPDGEV